MTGSIPTGRFSNGLGSGTNGHKKQQQALDPHPLPVGRFSFRSDELETSKSRGEEILGLESVCILPLVHFRSRSRSAPLAYFEDSIFLRQQVVKMSASSPPPPRPPSPGPRLPAMRVARARSASITGVQSQQGNLNSKRLSIQMNASPITQVARSFPSFDSICFLISRDFPSTK